MSRKERNIPYFIFMVILIVMSAIIIKRFVHIGMETKTGYVLLFDLVGIIIGTTMYLYGIKPALKKIVSKEAIAVILMLIPIVISFIPVSGEIPKKWFWFIPVNEKFVTEITPSFLSTLFGIILVSAVLVRNNPRDLFNKYSTYIFVAVDVFFCASFLKILCSSEIIKWIPNFNISYQGLLIVAVIFSWVGIRQIAGFIWAGIFILSISRLVAIDNTMGVLGSIYILSAFISGIIQWQVLDIHLSLKEIKTEFLAPVANTVLEDVSSAGKTLPNIVNDVSSVAGKVGGVAKQGVQSAVKHAEKHIENKKKDN